MLSASCGNYGAPATLLERPGTETQRPCKLPRDAGIPGSQCGLQQLEGSVAHPELHFSQEPEPHRARPGIQASGFAADPQSFKDPPSLGESASRFRLVLVAPNWAGGRGGRGGEGFRVLV